MHWDVDMEVEDEYKWIISDKGERHDWAAGAIVFIPLNTVHQHFNADPDKPARGIIFKVKPLCMFMNLIYQDFVEEAPQEPSPGHEDYRPIHLRELL